MLFRSIWQKVFTGNIIFLCNFLFWICNQKVIPEQLTNDSFFNIDNINVFYNDYPELKHCVELYIQIYKFGKEEEVKYIDYIYEKYWTETFNRVLSEIHEIRKYNSQKKLPERILEEALKNEFFVHGFQVCILLVNFSFDKYFSMDKLSKNLIYTNRKYGIRIEFNEKKPHKIMSSFEQIDKNFINHFNRLLELKADVKKEKTKAQKIKLMKIGRRNV